MTAPDSDAVVAVSSGLLALVLFAVHCLWTAYNLVDRFT